jgi:hypothetical protein
MKTGLPILKRASSLAPVNLTIRVPSRGETIRGTVTEGETSRSADWQMQFSQPEMGASPISRAPWPPPRSPRPTATAASRSAASSPATIPHLRNNHQELSRSESHKVTIAAGSCLARRSQGHSARDGRAALPSGECRDGRAGAWASSWPRRTSTRRSLAVAPQRAPHPTPSSPTTKAAPRSRSAEEWMNRSPMYPRLLLPAGYVEPARNLSRLLKQPFRPSPAIGLIQAQTHTIQLKRGRVLEGLVLDVDGSSRCIGAWVRSETDLVGVDTDERGRFALTMSGIGSMKSSSFAPRAEELVVPSAVRCGVVTRRDPTRCLRHARRNFPRYLGPRHRQCRHRP